MQGEPNPNGVIGDRASDLKRTDYVLARPRALATSAIRGLAPATDIGWLKRTKTGHGLETIRPQRQYDKEQEVMAMEVVVRRRFREYDKFHAGLVFSTKRRGPRDNGGTGRGGRNGGRNMPTMLGSCPDQGSLER